MNQSIFTSVAVALMVLVFSSHSQAQEQQFLKDVAKYLSTYCSQVEMTQVTRDKKSGLWDNILVACDSNNIFEVKNYFNTKQDPDGYLKVIMADPDFSAALSKEEPQGGLKFTNQTDFNFRTLVNAVDEKVFKLDQDLPRDRKNYIGSQYRSFTKK